MERNGCLGPLLICLALFALAIYNSGFNLSTVGHFVLGAIVGIPLIMVLLWFARTFPNFTAGVIIKELYDIFKDKR